MIPEAAAATGLYMVMCGSGASTLQYLLLHIMNLYYAPAMNIFTLSGALFSIFLIGKYIQKTGRTSILVFFLCFVIGASAILMPLFGTIRLVEKGTPLWRFKNMCSAA